MTIADPFFAIRFAVAGWFAYFVDSLLEALFLSIVLLYWLLMIDKIRMNELRMEFSKIHIPKIIVIGIYALLTVIFFTWVNIDDEANPVLGIGKTEEATSVLYYVIVALFMGCVIWFVILAVLTVPVVTAKPHLFTRFMFFVMPACFCILSIVIGMLAGTYGPVNRTSPEFVFFQTMWNVYLGILAYGYWPVEERFSVSNPSSGDRVV
jgi:hypothetical protein